MAMADVIREWLQQQFKPVVQVSASPAAQLICAKNGLELVDVLRPYSQLSQLQGGCTSCMQALCVR